MCNMSDSPMPIQDRSSSQRVQFAPNASAVCTAHANLDRELRREMPTKDIASDDVLNTFEQVSSAHKD